MLFDFIKETRTPKAELDNGDRCAKCPNDSEVKDVRLMMIRITEAIVRQTSILENLAQDTNKNSRTLNRIENAVEN